MKEKPEPHSQEDTPGSERDGVGKQQSEDLPTGRKRPSEAVLVLIELDQPEDAEMTLVCLDFQLATFGFVDTVQEFAA